MKSNNVKVIVIENMVVTRRWEREILAKEYEVSVIRGINFGNLMYCLVTIVNSNYHVAEICKESKSNVLTTNKRKIVTM